MADANVKLVNLESDLAPFVKQGQSGLLPALLFVQDQLGFVSDDNISQVADLFNLSKAEVFGVKSFYHDLHEEKPGQHLVKICRAEACRANGSQKIETCTENALKTKFDTTTQDGSVTLKSIYCLGTCAHGPSVMVNGEIHLRVTEEKIQALLKKLKTVMEK